MPILSNAHQRRVRRTLWVAALTAIPSASLAQTVFTTDASLPGTFFNTGVRGQAVPATAITRGDFPTAINKALAVARGSSLRGVAGGLEADLFNWETRNNSPRQGTLEYLRYSRDYNANLYITANIRGLVEPDPNTPGSQRFYDTSIPTLAALAGDWVRYTNHIVPTYRQGQTITDSRDQAILNSLTWSSSTPGDNFDKLLPAGEAAVPKVKYWEIGNEPRVGLSSSYKVTNSYTFSTVDDATHKSDYRARYAALTGAMLAEDPTIKVGPAMQWLSAVSEQQLLTSILQPNPDGSLLHVDFIGYHPYQKLNEQTMPDGVEAGLRNIYADHQSKITGIRNIISAAGRDPNSIGLVASEHNASNWSSNETPWEANMAHALGNTETVFSFARLGVQDAHYWIWPAHAWDGTEYPNYLATQKLRDHMGDKIVAVQADPADNLHLYTTKDSKTKQISLWGLNFSNGTNISRNTPITNVGGRGTITLYTLGALVGPTSLTSSNLASDMAGGPSHTVDWTTTDLTDTPLNTLNLTFPSATITLLTIDPWKQRGLPGDVNLDGAVNALDSTILTTNMNQGDRSWKQGDLTGDGLTNAADTDVFNANNGQVTGSRWTGGANTLNWGTRGNWQTNVVPSGIGVAAYLASVTTNTTSARTLTLNSAITLGSVTFDNTGPYTLGGTSTLKLQNTNTAPARVYVIQGSHKIDVPITLSSNTIVDVAQDATLRIGKALSVATLRSLTQTGAGAVVYESSLTILSGGRVTVSAGNHTARMGSLSIQSTGVLDLNDSDLVVQSGSFTALQSLVFQGYGNTNAGITSSTATGTQILALFDNALVGFSDYPVGSGNSIAAGAIAGKYTYIGDTNMDGQVTPQDYTAVDANLGSSAVNSGIAWFYGDTNFDGNITPQDYTGVDSALGLGQGNPLTIQSFSASAFSTVPEPAFTILPLAISALLHRRRRRCCSTRVHARS
jgi:hypothetical protein